MATIAFVNIPAHGHTNPTLPLVAELVQRGHRVAYFTYDAFAPLVAAAGADAYSYEDLFPFDYARLDTNLFRLSAFLLSATRRLLPGLTDRVAAVRPDLIVYDSLAPWGRAVSEGLGRPGVCSVTTFAMNNVVAAHSPVQIGNLLAMAPAALPLLPEFLQHRRALRREHALRVSSILSVFSNPSPLLNLVYTSRTFQPWARTFSPARYRFVGPTLAGRLNEAVNLPDAEGMPLVYVSLGTLFNDNPAFFKLCVRAFDGAPWRALLSVGEKVDPATLGALPPNLIVRRSVPQVGVLRQAALFLTHGGMNSVQEALWFGVPLLVLPQAADQEWVAQRVRALGAGRIVRMRTLSPNRLRAAVAAMLRDSAAAAASRLLGDTLRAAGGAPAAADAIGEWLA